MKPLRQKRTKILATISDRNCEPEFLQKLYDNGMNAVRMNTAHQTISDTKKLIDNVRKVSNQIPLVLDTKGPEVRTTEVEEPFEIHEGDILKMSGTADEKTISSKEHIYVNFPNFVAEIPVGTKILIDDGYTEVEVIEKDDQALTIKVHNFGLIKRKKSVNVPSVALPLIVLTDRDKEFIEFAIQEKIDYIAHSFVQKASDLQQIQEILDKHNSPIKLIAKVENQTGVDNIDEIIDNCAGIMIARGDLGVEIPAAEVPPIQKMIIKKCIKKNKIAITATQMLESMQNNPRPTRAEVSDVANAVLDGTGVLMLSGETASGKYPEEAVATMARIAQTIEAKKSDFKQFAMDMKAEDTRTTLAKAAMIAAQNVSAKAIIIPSVTGCTAKILSSFKAKIPIFAQCFDEVVMRELGLVYGVRAEMIEQKPSIGEQVSQGLKQLLDEKRLSEDDTVIVLGRTPEHEADSSNFLEINTIKNCLNNFP